MSSTGSTEKPAVFRKPAPDVYTVLLVISLLAIIVSCVFLYLYMADYQFKANKAAQPSFARVSRARPGACRPRCWRTLGPQEKDEG